MKTKTKTKTETKTQQLKYIVGGPRNITEVEYDLFLKYVNIKIKEGEILRFSASLEKGSKQNSKYHIQCIFEFDSTKFVMRDWSKKLKDYLRFTEVMMKSRKSCCFEKLKVGQTFMLIACGYNMKDPDRLRSDYYGITEADMIKYGKEYGELVNQKEKRTKNLYLGNFLKQCVEYSKDHKITNHEDCLINMLEDGYNFSNVIGKIPDALWDIYYHQINIKKLDGYELSLILQKKNLY